MYISIKEAHNMIGMLLLFVQLTVVVYVLAQVILKKPFDKLVQMFALMGLIVTHSQILIGVILYFISPVGAANFSGEAMGNTISRFYLVEHPFGMILAAVLITIGYRAAKSEKFSDKEKYKRVLILYSIGLTLTAYMVPWFVWN